MDARTGLGRFRDFRISNYELMMQLIDACRHHGIDEVLALPDVAERVDLYREQEPRFRDQLGRCTTVVRQPRRGRPPRRGADLRRQPLHGLRAAPRGEHLDARDAGQAAAEHRDGGRQVDLQPHVEAPTSARCSSATAAAATPTPAPARSPTPTPTASARSSSSASPPTADRIGAHGAGPGDGWRSDSLPSRNAHPCDSFRLALRSVRTADDVGTAMTLTSRRSAR